MSVKADEQCFLSVTILQEFPVYASEPCCLKPAKCAWKVRQRTLFQVTYNRDHAARLKLLGTRRIIMPTMGGFGWQRREFSAEPRLRRTWQLINQHFSNTISRSLKMI